MALAEPITAQVRTLEPERIRKAIARLQALPAFFPAVQKALQLLKNPDAGDAQVEQAIASDQAMAARVLRLANSAYFGYYQRVSTVSLALALIGRDKVSTLLLRFLTEELLTMLSGRKLAALRIREMSVTTAAAAHALADRLARRNKEELLLAGLLHNIGELVLLSEFRAWYEQMLRLAEQMPTADAERAVFGIESRMVGKWLLEAWKFPEFFPAVIERHADPWAAPSSPAPLVDIALVHAARLLAEARQRRQTVEQWREALSPRLLTTLEVDAQFLGEVYEQLPDQPDRLQLLVA